MQKVHKFESWPISVKVTTAIEKNCRLYIKPVGRRSAVGNYP